jgi:hypothetical protein
MFLLQVRPLVESQLLLTLHSEPWSSFWAMIKYSNNTYISFLILRLIELLQMFPLKYWLGEQSQTPFKQLKPIWSLQGDEFEQYSFRFNLLTKRFEQYITVLTH